MSFSDSVKREIFSKQIKERHCKIAFLSGLVRGSGALYEKDGEIGLELKVFSEELARYISEYIRNLFGYEIRDVSVSEDRLNKKDKIVLNIVGDKLIEILEALEIVTEKEGELIVNMNFYGERNKSECCLRSFIRGLFVTAGSCTIPSDNQKTSTGYHLELDFSHSAPASDTSHQLAQYGIMPKVIRRRDSYVLYLKSVEEIKDFLAFLPAPISVLKLTDLIINRELSNKSNRQKNCDLGNVNKQVEASAKQLEAIYKIEQTIGLEGLKDEDRAVAVARKAFPDYTLTELAEHLDLTKSCLNHRLRKIVNIANEL